MDVHARDVLSNLCKEGIKRDDEFGWLCQLRYYLVEDEETKERDVMCRMINSELAYG
jgi:dynein heavy chain